MSQHDYIISNDTGANVRSDLNNALGAIATVNSGATEPSTTYAYQLWMDTANNVLKMRNSANSAWYTLPISPVANNTVDINGGTIDGVTIGGSSAGAITGTTITGTSFVTSGDMTFGDNDKAIFGAGSDLQIYHDGSKSIINDAGTGNLEMQVGGSTKLATTSTGIDVTGDMTPTGHLYLSDTKGVQFGNNGYFGNNASDYLQLKTQDTQRMRIASNGDISFYEATGTTAKFFWDASAESLGIGTSSPSGLLHLSANTDDTTLPSIVLQDSGTTATRLGVLTNNGGDINLSATASLTDIRARVSVRDDRTILFSTNSAEAMRIDSNGSLLVGKTTTSTATVGAALVYNGQLRATVDGDFCAYINRETSDGSIVDFRYNNVSGGTIGIDSPQLYIAGTTYGLRFNTTGVAASDSSGTSVDNSMDLGASGTRFDDVYATNGTIQTSDRNEKQDIEELSEAEQRVAVAAKGLLRKYRWKDSVAEKGDEARIHFGIIAQDLQAAFEAEGLDAGRYGMFIHSTWWETYTDVPAVEAKDAVLDEEDNVIEEAVEAKEAYTRTDIHDEPVEGATEKSRMGIRYPELLAFIIAAI